MTYNQPDRYQKFLQKAAQKWDCTDPAEAAELQEITEVLAYDAGNQIRLFVFNDQYGYCMDLRLKRQWSLYGPCPKFSDPYPSQQAALEAAALHFTQEVRKNHEGPEVKKMILWAKLLTLPEQLSLF